MNNDSVMIPSVPIVGLGASPIFEDACFRISAMDAMQNGTIEETVVAISSDEGHCRA